MWKVLKITIPLQLFWYELLDQDNRILILHSTLWNLQHLTAQGLFYSAQIDFHFCAHVVFSVVFVFAAKLL